MTKEEYLDAVYKVVDPWINERTTNGIGPRLVYFDNRLNLYDITDTEPFWRMDVDLSVDILNCKNALTLEEDIHGLMLCLEARIDKKQRWRI